MAVSLRSAGAPIFGVALAACGAACGLEVTGQIDPGPPPEPVEPRPPAPEIASAPAFCDPGDPTLIACARFEEGVKDESSHAQAFDVTGTVAVVDGARGRAAGVDATTMIHVPHGPAWSYDSLTVEMWIRPRELPAEGERAGLLDKNGSFGMFLQSNGEITCTMGGGVRSTAVALDRWTHVACVNGGGRVTLYVDGAEAAGADAGAVGPTDAVAAIGGDSPSGAPFVGALDELRVFARARTSAEVAESARR